MIIRPVKEGSRIVISAELPSCFSDLPLLGLNRYWVGTIDIITKRRYREKIGQPRIVHVRRRVLYCLVNFVPRYFYLAGSDKGEELMACKWLKKRVEVDLKWVEGRFGKGFIGSNKLK